MSSVVYLTDTRYGQRAWQHPSARHRCYHYADAILSLGGDAAVIPMERITVAKLARFDHAVFHRPVWNKRFKHAIDCCRDAGLQLHADYDDLIFHPDFAEYSPQYLNGGKELAKIRRQFEDTFNAAKCFNSFLVSTAYLSDKIRHLFTDTSVTVLPNAMPRTFCTPNRNAQFTIKPTIGYFPGSRGHGEDFKSITKVLKSVLDTGVRLLLVGRMDQQDYQDLPNVVHLPFADYTDYLKYLSLVDVSIAPLVDNEFNRSKSAVKLIESVSVGTPIVASKNQDMSDHDNELSWLVSDEKQWQSALHEVLDRDSTNDNMEARVHELQVRFSVTNRLSILQEHLQCAA